MGAILVMELLANQPPSPPAEWPLLLQLAADADDRTRQTACGFDYMAERTHAPRATIYRWLKSLREAGQIVTVEKSAGGAGGQKGKRAVYEIQVPAILTARIADQIRGESGLTGGDPTQGQKSGSRVPSGETRVGSRVPQLVRPPIYGPVSDAPVEGAQERRDQERAAGSKTKIDPLIRPERLREGAGRVGRTSTHEDPQPDSKAQDRRGVSSPADVDVTRARARGDAA